MIMRGGEFVKQDEAWLGKKFVILELFFLFPSAPPTAAAYEVGVVL